MKSFTLRANHYPTNQEVACVSRMNDALQLLATIYEDKEYDNLCHKQKEMIAHLTTLGYLSDGMHGFVGCAL